MYRAARSAVATSSNYNRVWSSLRLSNKNAPYSQIQQRRGVLAYHSSRTLAVTGIADYQHRSSSAVWYVGAGVVLTTASILSFWEQEQPHSFPTQCDAAAATAEFHLLTALDARDEMEKVRLAQILHDLHDLATTTATNAMKKGRLRRFVTMALGDRSKQQPHEAQNQTINKDNETPHPQIGNHIDFQGLDLTQLSKPDALHIIDAITTGSTLDIANLKSLLQTATNLLKTEPNLISLGTKASQKKTKRDWGVRRKSPSAPPRDHQDDIVAVIGDLHGSLDSLTHILQLLNVQNLDENKKQVVVFNGDFVDRGQHSLEVLLTLLILKLAFPKQVYLIRGNHEDTYVASVYGFQDEIRRKYGEGQTSDIWKSIGNIFGALPIALTTNHALVVHGGLPGADFDLPTLEQLPPETRWSLETTVNPQTQHEKLLCNILWSDPTETDSQCLSKNPRGLGILFGSQVAHDFLKRHQLQYLVRGHEVVAKGVRDMNCGSGKSVITVFSAAAYPSDTGSNDGAVLHLHPDGSYTHESYSLRDTSASCEKVKSQTTEQALEKVRTMIGCNRSKLEKAFAQVPQASAGKVTVDQWVQVMSETIEFAGMPWVALQSRLAPAESSFWSSTSLIDVKAFLQSHSFKLHNSTDMEDEETETLAENHEMLLTVFKFLDTDGNGTLSPDEFKTGVNLLNKRLPPGRQLQNPEALFQNLDIDGNGEISFDEFTHGFGMT